MGVVRHADAGYNESIVLIKKSDINSPIIKNK
jgi:urocanate hydratase